MRLAVFDIDGTLLGGASSERRFAAWLLRRREIGAVQGLAWLGFLVVAWPRFGRHVAKKDKGYVAGLDVGHVASLARRFVDEVLLERLDPAVLIELGHHRARGEPVWLLSGTLQPLADALAERVGAAGAVGSRAPAHGGRYRVGAPRRHPFGDEKLALVRDGCAALGTTLDAVVAYGDSIHDRALLERAGTPIAVEPDAALARLARERGWTVLRHGDTLADAAPSVHAR